MKQTNNHLSRIGICTQNLAEQQKKALIPFITCGDPINIDMVELMHALVKHGADMLELGVPFSDPSADGQVIQQSSDRAISHGIDLPLILKKVTLFRQTDQTTPIILMSYANPIFKMGLENFAKQAHAAGVDGVLVVDIGHGLQPWHAIFKQYYLDCIYLVSPTTSLDRIAHLKQFASGYIYYVSLKGVTGAATLNTGAICEHVANIKKQLNLPLMLGFGIDSAEKAKQASQISDGVIIGSKLVKHLHEEAEPLNWLANWLPNIVDAIQSK